MEKTCQPPLIIATDRHKPNAGTETGTHVEQTMHTDVSLLPATVLLQHQPTALLLDQPSHDNDTTIACLQGPKQCSMSHPMGRPAAHQSLKAIMLYPLAFIGAPETAAAMAAAARLAAAAAVAVTSACCSCCSRSCRRATTTSNPGRCSGTGAQQSCKAATQQHFV